MPHRIAVIGTGAGYTGNTIPPAPILELAGAGFSAELVETRLRNFPMTPADRALTVLAYLDCAIEAEKAGFDAVLINTFGDYGIDAIKSATNMVVVGAGEATMAMSCNIGSKFSIVTIWPPKLNFIYQERLRSCGMADRCVSVRNVTSDEEVAGIEGAGKAISELKEQSRSMQDRILQAIDLCVNKDGADTILLGCTCMAPVAPDIARQASVPVLDPMRTAYKTTESMLALGVRHSNKVYPKAQASSVAAVGALIEGGGDVDLGGGCEICVLENNNAD